MTERSLRASQRHEDPGAVAGVQVLQALDRTVEVDDGGLVIAGHLGRQPTRCSSQLVADLHRDALGELAGERGIGTGSRRCLQGKKAAVLLVIARIAEQLGQLLENLIDGPRSRSVAVAMIR